MGVLLAQAKQRIVTKVTRLHTLAKQKKEEGDRKAVLGGQGTPGQLHKHTSQRIDAGPFIQRRCLPLDALLVISVPPFDEVCLRLE